MAMIPVMRMTTMMMMKMMMMTILVITSSAFSLKGANLNSQRKTKVVSDQMPNFLSVFQLFNLTYLSSILCKCVHNCCQACSRH